MTCLLLSSENFLLAALDTVSGGFATLHQLLHPRNGQTRPAAQGPEVLSARRVGHGTWYADSFFGQELPRLIVPNRSPLAATRGAPQ